MTVTPQRLWLQFRRHKGKVPELILVNHRKMSLIDRSQNWLFFYEVWVKIADIFSGFLLKKKKKGSHGHIVYIEPGIFASYVGRSPFQEVQRVAPHWSAASLMVLMAVTWRCFVASPPHAYFYGLCQPPSHSFHVLPSRH